jgi:hypothetical protein
MKRPPSPLKTLGIILFAPLSFAWQLLHQFLLSPWGLVVPMTLLIALLALPYVHKSPTHLALFYAEQLETCDEEELPRLIAVLLRMEDAGVTGLVKGLTSQRESVFTACRNILQSEFDRWKESPQREHHYRVFSEALLNMSDQFSHAGQAEAIRFVDQIMQIRATAPSPESIASRQKTIDHCGQLLSQLESQRRRRIEPLDKEFAPPADNIASLNRRTNQQVLLASSGQPFAPASARGGNETHLAQSGRAGATASFNSFSDSRTERLAAYQRTQQNNDRTANERETPMLAGFSAPPSVSADIENKFAQLFSAQESETFPVPNIADEYRNKIISESDRPFGSDTFLSPELQSTPLDRVPQLPTTKLMQLLHHPEPAYVESAQRTLASRDGFQEPHLKLAWRLYHPIPAVRQEIMDMLPNTQNVQASVWLTVLLNDPNNDVRYRTASFLATANDPALQRLLIDRGKRDSDARIVNLAERLNDARRY